MKKLPALFYYAITCIIIGFSCIYNNDNGHTSFSVNESDHYYSMNAHFGKSKTRDVEEYLDRRIGRRSNLSLVNSQTDATLTFDDHTKFYMKKSPGFIEIKLGKDENSDEAYRAIKAMCEGIKIIS